MSIIGVYCVLSLSDKFLSHLLPLFLQLDPFVLASLLCTNACDVINQSQLIYIPKHRYVEQ